MKNRKGRPTTLTVSVMDNEKNAIVYTGSIAGFVDKHFMYCNDIQKKNTKSVLYQSMKTGCTALDGKLRVFKNLESL